MRKCKYDANKTDDLQRRMWLEEAAEVALIEGATLAPSDDLPSAPLEYQDWMWEV